MMKLKTLSACILAMALSGCSGLFDKDNTPEPTALTPIRAEIQPKQRWSVRAGDGTTKELLKLSPSLQGNTLYATSSNGLVTAIDRLTGQIRWQVDTKEQITTGPGVGDGIIAIGTRHGGLIALQETDGHFRWKSNISGEILAKPAVSQQRVVAKATNGYLQVFAVSDGATLWAYQEREPSLILHNASHPVIHNGNIYVGFANGRLAKFGLVSGNMDWMQPIAIAEGGFPIQRMIDIDADPLIYDYHLYAATYQGKIAALSMHTGQLLWSHDISSYTGMSADDNTVFISDAKSTVWAFGANNGLVNWRQAALESRNVSGPISMGNYVVVGDGEGYLHWLSKRDGHIAARDFAGAPIYATPIVANNMLYAFTTTGYLIAYTLS